MAKSGVLGTSAIEYDRYCYLRYLAMAAVGGGWMSDYDTLPLSITADAVLPNNGTFTVYESAVPSLISGNETEWSRMTRTLVNAGMERVGGKTVELFSDMMALQSLGGMGVFRSEERILGADHKFGHALFSDDVCNKAKGKLAAHFSHYSLGVLNIPQSKRLLFAKSGVGGWSQECNSNSTDAERAAASQRRREFFGCIVQQSNAVITPCCHIVSALDAASSA